MSRTRSSDFVMRWGLCLLTICVVLAVTDGRHTEHKHKARVQRSSSKPDARIDNIKEVLFGSTPKNSKVKQASSDSSVSDSSVISESSVVSASSTSAASSMSVASSESDSGSVPPVVNPPVDPPVDPPVVNPPDSSNSGDDEDNLPPLPKNPLAPQAPLKAEVPASEKPAADKPLEVPQ